LGGRGWLTQKNKKFEGLSQMSETLRGEKRLRKNLHGPPEKREREAFSGSGENLT